MTYKTCVSIAEKTPKKLKQTLAKALKKSDYAEIRFDFLNPNAVPETLHLIRKDLRRCVSTLRPTREGGKFSGSEKNRISIIKLIAEYNPFLLDIEYDTLRKNRNLQRYLKNTGTNTLVSWHNFKQTPTVPVLKKKLLEMKKFSNFIKNENNNFNKNKDELKKIIDDTNSEKDIKDLAVVELQQLEKNNKINEKKIQLFLLPKDEADAKNAIIELRAGTGGLEASLFASDLFKMYEKVSHKKKWLMDVISISKSDAGGLKEVIATIKGKNIYSSLKYESGVHRVQRVPDTETQGRVHTSAATVAVLPEAEEVDVKINEKSNGKTTATIKVDSAKTGAIVGRAGRNAEKARLIAKRYFEINNIKITNE